ncbi:MAG: DNA gyrase subunit A [Patescibacteria group bacterium]|nr:DNA gyrase subunit A [Patescibacteria group bacterium]
MKTKHKKIYRLPHKESKIKPEISDEIITGRIDTQSLEDEVKTSYLDYAMSVIVARALPDVRDGLKPVHRRILYAMHSMGLKHSVKYRKSATVVGEVLGHYHPHGDMAVYDSMVRMAQDFSLRYPLIDGQGNFGSIDGDGAAAHRYTEARLSAIADEMLLDIDKETVNFTPNYDGTLTEPQVLPARLPNLLLNGSMGIAVGMATNIPPHNLGELCDAIGLLIDHPHAEIDELFKFVKGPDFPTGGLIFDVNQIKQAYAIGKGPIVVRAKTEIVETKQGYFQIIVHEIPYGVNKSDLLQKMAELVKDKKIDDIRDIRDESGKEGIRVIIELKKGTFPQKVLNKLFQSTSLQTVFYVNMVALSEGIQPKVFGLKEILEEYIDHRQIIIRKRTEYILRQTQDRIHILKGLEIAIDYIDEIIKLIKKSQDKNEAKINLMKKYRLSDLQADAILEMKLHQLANLERNRIKDELKEKLALAKELEKLLASPKMILEIVKKDLKELKEKYGDDRRTQVVTTEVGKFSDEDLIPDEPTLVVITRDGYIKRLASESFKSQSRGGKGVVGLEVKDEDQVKQLISTTTHTNLLFFTTKGRAFQLKAHEIPQTGRAAKGQALVNFLEVSDQEKVSVVLPSSNLKNSRWIVMVTKQGTIKKLEISAFDNVRRSGLIAIKLKGDDSLDWTELVAPNDEIILVSAHGQAVRFKEKDLKPLGRVASGVRGMKLKKDDYIVGMGVIDNKEIANKKLLIVAENGFGKMTPIKEYRLQRRGGSGIKTAKVTDKIGKIIGAIVVDDKISDKDLLLISHLGQVIRLPLKSVSTTGRATQGVRLMRFNTKDIVVSCTLI